MVKSILFNAKMVRAILDGRKTVTRRVVKGSEDFTDFIDLSDDTSVIAVDRNGIEYDKALPGLWATFDSYRLPEYPVVKAPYCPGDTLWIRETFREFHGILYGWSGGVYIPLDDIKGYQYKSDNSRYYTQGPNLFCREFEDQKDNIDFGKWRPSVHMPIEAARIFLRVTDVRVERLQELTEYDAYSEGCRTGDCGDKLLFQSIWNNTIKPADRDKYGWGASPWV